MSKVFYNCPTWVQLCLVQKHFYVIYALSNKDEGIQPLILRLVFYHCVTGVQLSLVQNHFYVISALSKKVSGFQPLYLG
jgi:hypothetical protein